MKTFLIAGFRKFGDYQANSSEQVVTELRKTGRLGSSKIVTEILPTEIGLDLGYGLFESAIYKRAEAIVIFGMASDKRGLSIETCAANRLGHPKYYPTPGNIGYPIDPNIPFGQRFRMNLCAWKIGRFRVACEDAGVPVEMSTDAGGFCCNHLMFRLSRLQEIDERYRRIPWVFIHIPCSTRSVPKPRTEFDQAGKMTMEPDEVIQGLEILLRNF
jgi:pyroglutamyl-peptidase